MKIIAIKTKKVRPGDDLFTILDARVKRFSEGSVLAVTSKIISLCEGNVVPVGSISKEKLIAREAGQYLPRTASRYDVSLTITNGILAASAGIDESNAEGNYVLWPRDSFASARAIRAYLVKRFRVRLAGVVVTDSKTTPLRWGTTGFALAWSGFKPLQSYIGKPDIFGRNLKMTKANIADGLAAAAVLLMGEGNEQTPLAILSELPFVSFAAKHPTGKEIQGFRIRVEDDLYAPLLRKAGWRRGQGRGRI